MTCSMFNADVPVWRRNGKTIMSNRHVWSRKHFFDRRGIKFYLEISNVTKDDEGLYMCSGHAHGMSDNKTLYLQTGLSKRARKNNKLRNEKYPRFTTIHLYFQADRFLASLSDHVKHSGKQVTKQLQQYLFRSSSHLCNVFFYNQRSAFS